MGSISNNSGQVVCEAFTPHFFKPTYCIHCFKTKAVHSIKMPSQQNTLNGHHHEIMENEKPMLGSVNAAKANLWIKNATSKETSIGSSSSPLKAGRKPVLRSCFGRQTTSADGKLCHPKRSPAHIQNAYQPCPVIQHHQYSKGAVSNKTADWNGIIVDGNSANYEHVSLPPSNDEIASLNGGNPSDANLYEPIFPSDGNIENFDNQTNAILESKKINQRSHSDAASYRKQCRHSSRRISTPTTMIPESVPCRSVLEFQKVAGRLKHTGRRDSSGSPPEGEVGVLIHASQQQKKIFAPRCGYSQVDTPGCIPDRGRKVVPQRRHHRGPSSPKTKTNANVSRTHNGSPYHEKACLKSSASSTSSGEFGCDEASKSRSSSVTSCPMAPAVPVRTDSRKKNKKSNKKPGFALESFLPESITIISADGTKEVLTASGTFETNAKDDKQHVEAVREGLETSTRDQTLENVTSQTNIPNGSRTDIGQPLSSAVSSCSDVAYEVITVGPIHNHENEPLEGYQQTTEPWSEYPTGGNKPATEDASCNGLSNINSKGEVATSCGGEDSIPPFPIILHDDNEHKTKNRHSGNYKVPIFIKQQDYDNLGTVQADQDYEAMQLLQPDGESRKETSSDPHTCKEVEEDQYYLQPADKMEPIGYGESHTDDAAVNEDEYELVRHVPNPTTSSAEEEKAMKEKDLPGPVPRRSRSKTHPMFCKEGHLVSGVLPHAAASKSKMKRTAPRPPEFSKEDTMPRTPPPPPPTDVSHRMSKDLHEGILRYQRSAHASKGLHALKASDFEKRMKSQMQLLKTETKPSQMSIDAEKENANIRQEPEIEDRKIVDNATCAERRHKVIPNLHVSASRGKSAPKPMVSPPRTHLLHQLHLQSESPPSSGSHESRQKEKKSLMFWKKRKRKDEGGSPEREYNTEIVTQWLEKLDEATPVDQRHSWERMEVINAYKGQETAVIGYKDQVDGHETKNTGQADIACGGKRKAPKPPRETVSSSDSTSQPSPKPLERKNSADIEKSNDKSRDTSSFTTSGSDQINQEIVDFPVKPPPRTKSQRKRRETIHEAPEYVNLAFLKQSKTPPAKPRRRVRATRSLTTGFENLPSATKRMAPKAPDEDAASNGRAEFHSTSDPESAMNDLDETLNALVPLKSVLKKKTSESVTVAVRDAETPPKRPVRLIHADTEPPESHQYGLPKSGYVNLEVKQIKCGRTPDEISGAQEEDASILCQIQSMQCQTLAHLGQLYPMNKLTKELFQERSWQDFIIHERTLSFADEKTFCFRAELKEHSEEFGIMVFLHQSNLDKVYEAAKELEAFPPHLNVLSVVHTFRAEVPLYLFTNSEDEASQSETRGPLPGQSDAVVVVTRQVPTSSAAHFIEESRSRDGENTEHYEAQVWGMVLQVCRGLSHAQKCEPANTLEGLKQESVLQMGKGSGVWLFNPLLVETLSTSVPGRRNSVVSHLTDKCCEFDLGILIYELLHQPNPFAVRTSLMSRNYTPEELPALPNESSFSAKLQSLVSELLRRCPEERASANQALGIIYAQKFCQILSSSASELKGMFVGKGLGQLIAVKQTEVMCNLTGRLCGGSSNEFSVWEKLDLIFWSEVDCSMLEKALIILTGNTQ